ncbi:competence/damage-inducible protein A [Inquilinus limosus]|uniref:Competence/damage-inducible protein A n=1 Tax=Inquilinus limosus TaxID=171674 RepID=A0A211ZG52_9PROT|nr:molybdopterin-binding protein [Inquilinus limosus]OWJ64223.1 competence/damage-inducible protein A [Inquilinus limosus]
MTDTRIVTAAVLVIGDEILSGRTKDANMGFLAERLTELGIRLREARVVPDVPEEIIAAVNALRARYDYVFTTGGIGPTHDDITAECVARAFGVPLLRHPEAVRRLEAHYEPGQLNEARLRMANVPEGGTLIDNPVSAAPGFRIGNVHVMAGVPRIMQAMFDGIAPTLAGGDKVLSRTVTCDLGEGVIAAGLGAIAAEYSELSVGSYPYFRAGKFGTSLVLRGTDAARLSAATEAVRVLVVSLGGTAGLESEKSE